MRAVRFEQVKLHATAWRRFLMSAETAGLVHNTKIGRKAENLAWSTNNSPAMELELQGKQHRRYFSYEIHSDRNWGNMSAVFFVHVSNAEWGKARTVLESMEDMASRFACYPYGEIEN